MPGINNLLVLGSVEVSPEMLVLSEDKTQSWIQVVKPISNAKKGTHAFSITDQHIDQMMSNAQKSSTQIPVDYNHLSLGATNADQAAAAGWFCDFKKENLCLYGLVDWTSKAAERIRNKEFRYISPTINFAAQDEHGDGIGASLISAALTIYPFLKGMDPVALTDLYAQRIILADLSIDERRSRLSQAISAKFPMDYAWLVDVFDDYAVFERAGKKYRLSYKMGKDFGVEFSGEAQEVVPQYEVIAANSQPSGAPMPTQNNEQPNQDIVQLRDSLTTLTTTVQSLQQNLTDANARADSERARADELVLRLNTQEAEHAVDALIRAKKVKVGDKPKWVKMYLKDKEMFVELTATLSSLTIVTNREHGSSEGDGNLESETAEAQDPVAQLTAAVDKYIADHGGPDKVKYDVALAAVTKANPELATNYRSAFQVPTTVVN